MALSTLSGGGFADGIGARRRSATRRARRRGYDAYEGVRRYAVPLIVAAASATLFFAGPAVVSALMRMWFITLPSLGVGALAMQLLYGDES